MRKNFISSKTAIGFMAFTLLLTGMTGCYKDSRLDVTEPGTGPVVTPDAAYSISGTVTDAETGESVNCTVTASVGTPAGGSGAYNVALTKAQVGEGVNVELTFTAVGYTTTTRSVYVQKINDGSSIVYPVSVSLKKEYVTISGYVTDVNNKMVAAREISVRGTDVEPKYNASTFSFKIAKETGVSEYTVDAKVLDGTGTQEITVSAIVKLEANKFAYNGINLKFGFAISDDGQMDDEGGNISTIVISPELNENGETTKEIVTQVADNSTNSQVTVTIPAGTKIEGLNGQSIVISSYQDFDTGGTDEGESTDNNVVLKTFTGLPDGATFTPALQIGFNDQYEGLLGNSFVLQYLNNSDNTWSTEEAGGVELKDGSYTMHVPHFSTFRAALDMKTSVKIDTVTVTNTVDADFENAEDTPYNNYKISHFGYAGSQYADFGLLEREIASNFANENAQNLVRSSIEAIYPAAMNGYYDREYTHYVNIDAWTKLVSYDVTTATETRTYTVDVNGKKISFTVETILSVKISVDDDNMISIGHGHGHGDDDNAGGGIVTGD